MTRLVFFRPNDVDICSFHLYKIEGERQVEFIIAKRYLKWFYVELFLALNDIYIIFKCSNAKK